MKNIFKSLCLAATMILIMGSCAKDAEIPDRGPVVHPQEEVKGVYVGQWGRQQSGKDEITYADGTIELSPAEANYVTNITVSCPDFKLNKSSVANIAPGGEGYMYSNVNKDGNGFGTEFAGKIYKDDMSITMSFKITERVGIKSQTNIYTFNGKRN